MGSFTCCIWWLVFGVLLGWLLSWWLSKLIGNKPEEIEEIRQGPSLKERYFDAPGSTTDTYTPSPLADVEPQEAQPQASAVTLSRSDMINAAAAAGISFSGKHNDLEIIAELSKASVVSLEAILESGGDRFRIANPGTWAQQALLASENKWTELKALQDSLDGGIEKS
jgi:hypothetical protein